MRLLEVRAEANRQGLQIYDACDFTYTHIYTRVIAMPIIRIVVLSNGTRKVPLIE